MPYKNKEDQKIYQMLWLRRRREEARQYLGGKCVQCNSTENLEIDHIDRSTKWKHNFHSYKKEIRESELSKCQLLCKKCHSEKTAIENGRMNHGTSGSWRRGCRCQICRDHHARKTREYRARKKLENPNYRTRFE